jgi:hypothetical protein
MTPTTSLIDDRQIYKFASRIAFSLAAAIPIALLSLATPVRAGDAKGTLSYKGKTVSLNFAYLVKGPDAVETKTIIRRVILSATDLTAKIQSCNSMNCSDADLSEGLAVDFDIGPRLGYRIAMNNGLVQYSFGTKPDAWKGSNNTPTRLQGKLSFDDTFAGGPVVDVEFDASLLKEFKLAR